MKLNIETTDTDFTLAVLRQVYFNASVSLLRVYTSTADYSVVDTKRAADDQVYSLEGLLELAASLGISEYKIRVY